MSEEYNDPLIDEIFESIPVDKAPLYNGVPEKSNEDSFVAEYDNISEHIQFSVPRNYKETTLNGFDILIKNQKAIDEKFSTNEEPNGAWMLENPDEIDDEELTEKIKQLNIKLRRIQQEISGLKDENKRLTSRRDTLQASVSRIEEERRRQNELAEEEQYELINNSTEEEEEEEEICFECNDDNGNAIEEEEF